MARQWPPPASRNATPSWRFPTRFELVTLHGALLIRRLRAEGTAAGDGLAQAVFDAMFSDMDLNLREMGIGDMTVGKRVKMLWEGFHGRAQAYAEAIAAGDASALAAALERNIWVSEPAPEGAPAALAARALRIDGVLAGQDVAGLLQGEVHFA